MADDIDDLLDQCESLFSTRSARSLSERKLSKPNDGSYTVSSSSRSNQSSDSLDDVIEDIIRGGDDNLSVVTAKNENSKKRLLGEDGAQDENLSERCFTIYLAGTLSPLGSVTEQLQKICDRLHCTSCDNRVVAFEHYNWNSSGCDYLFFRNNYPDFSRLQSCLKRKRDSRSYCCQCSWVSLDTVQKLHDVAPSFKWMCRKH